MNISINQLLKYEIAPIPRYLILRDILKLPKNDPQMIEAKTNMLQTKWVKSTIDLQKEDGSFGYFHSLNYSNTAPITTEQALRRLKILGLDYDDLCIQKAILYLERFLKGEVDFPDRKEKLHNWTIFTNLMVAAQIRQFSPENKLALDIGNTWKRIIEYAFSDYKYSQERYEEAYTEVFSIKSKGGRLIDFVNFYPIALLKRLLTKQTECRMLDYIINKSSGIYYIYDNCINTPPQNFASKYTNRYLTAIELLSEYTYSKEKLSFVTKWFNDNVGQDGFWDMGANVNDKVLFPISNSWRKAINRKIDCTVIIMSILCKLGYDYNF